MKKTIAALLAVILVFGILAGCGKKTEEAGKTSESPATAQAGTVPEPIGTAPAGGASAQTETKQPDVYSAGGSVVFEKDGVKITTAGLDSDPTSEGEHPIIWLDIENTGEKDAFPGVSCGSVNGFMCTVVLIAFQEDGGVYYGADYTDRLSIPAGSSGRYALGYYKQDIPVLDMDTLGELGLCFTMAEDEFSWPEYTSEPIVIKTGEEVEEVDITSLGEVVLDSEKLKLVIGRQDYDEWFGPLVMVYAENRTDRYIGIAADTAEADTVTCDYVYYGERLAPGRQSAGFMSFEGDIKELRGFESLSVSFTVSEADTMDGLDGAAGTALGTFTVEYPPQVWGEYESGGLKLEIKPAYNELITVARETPENHADGILFTVSETASLEAGGYEGAGWLFSIAKVTEEKVHELMCYDMSGVEVFAKDGQGNYYLYCHPTDVRYERRTAEEMSRDAAQWSMLCGWAGTVPASLVEQNGLEAVSFGNSEVEIYVARAAFAEGQSCTLSTTEFGPLETKGTDGTPYAEYVILHGGFTETDDEAPDGEYVVLSFPDEDLRLDFFFAPGGYVRAVSGSEERLYQAGWYDESVSYAEAMQGWYYALAEKEGLREHDGSLEPFCGEWDEKIAGRGVITIAPSVAPGKVNITVGWPESAAVVDLWEMTASLEEERLMYENGVRTVIEFDENGEDSIVDQSYEESGWFYISAAGELCWHDEREAGEESTFIR